MDQTLAEAKSNHRMVTSYVTISKKRIDIHTIYVYRQASVAQYAKRMASWIGSQLTLPSATLFLQPSTSR